MFNNDFIAYLLMRLSKKDFESQSAFGDVTAKSWFFDSQYIIGKLRLDLKIGANRFPYFVQRL